MAEDPKAYAVEYRKEIEADIEQYGRHIVGVFSRDDDPPFAYTIVGPPFAYTIGNWTRRFPELLIVGFWHDVGYLNALSEEMLKRGRAFGDSEVVELKDWSAPFKLINANAIAQAEYTVQAGVFYGTEDYPVQQILLQSRQGHWPGTPQYRVLHPMPVLARQ